MNLNSSGRIDSFRYVRVDRVTFAEIEEVDGILDGGTIDLNDLTSIKATGSLPYFRAFDIANDYLRVYLDMELNGEQESDALGTFLVSTPKQTITGTEKDGPIISGSVELYSVLQVLVDDCFDDLLIVSAGTNAVSFAAVIVSLAGLPVIAAPSSATLNTISIYDPKDYSKLDIINDLLKYAGFSSLGVDGYGNVLMSEYTDPANLTPVIEFKDGEGGCRFMPDVDHEQDDFSVPNKINVTMSSPDKTLRATAINDDPTNRFSTVSKGRNIVFQDEVSDIPSQSALNAYAQKLLSDKTSSVESVTITHPYQRYNTGDAGHLDYNAANLDFVGIAASKELTLVPGVPTKARFRVFLRS